MEEVVRKLFNNQSNKDESEFLCFLPIIDTETKIKSRRAPDSGYTPIISTLCTVIMLRDMPALMKVICVRNQLGSQGGNLRLRAMRHPPHYPILDGQVVAGALHRG